MTVHRACDDARKAFFSALSARGSLSKCQLCACPKMLCLNSINGEEHSSTLMRKMTPTRCNQKHIERLERASATSLEICAEDRSLSLRFCLVARQWTLLKHENTSKTKKQTNMPWLICSHFIPHGADAVLFETSSMVDDPHALVSQHTTPPATQPEKGFESSKARDVSEETNDLTKSINFSNLYM